MVNARKTRRDQRADATVLRPEVILGAIVATVPATATAMRTAINAYSIAVAPLSSRKSRFNVAGIVFQQVGD